MTCFYSELEKMSSENHVKLHADPLASKKEAWSGRFSEPMADFVLRYTASVGFDKRLAKADIAGSLAHARMLAKTGIISKEDLAAIERGMKQISEEIKNNTFKWKLELEDVHLNIEARLTHLIGDAGKRLHTGRSRNDQVALDIRLYVRDQIKLIVSLLEHLQHSLLSVAEKNIDTIMPGFTHMQIAQPVSFGHHLLAYVEMFERDRQRFLDCFKRVNVSPLGAAALAGTTYPIDREFVASQLEMDSVTQNSLDSVSDRDFAVEFCSCASLTMVHISRLSEELIYWMSFGFGFIELPDRFTTGSSIMPQKKNPDVPEAARGKTGRVVGHLMGLLMLMKGQPLAYNKDNQEDKEPLFDTIDTVVDTLRAFAEMIPGIQVRKDNMKQALNQGFATATDFADYLVRKGLPFRDAHEAVGCAVRLASEKNCQLHELSLEELKQFNSLIDEDVYKSLTLEGSLRARNHIGGTAPEQVQFQVNRWKKILAERE